MTIDDGTLPGTELLRLHALSQSLIDQSLIDLQPDDLRSATPCPDWDVRALLAHVLGQNLGLTAAAKGADPEPSAWQPADLGSDPAGAIAVSAQQLVSAFDQCDLGGTLWMPDLSPAAPLPARMALLAHLVDTVVHGWDVAVALGKPYSVPGDVLSAAAAVAFRVPDGTPRSHPGAAFGPAIPAVRLADPGDGPPLLPDVPTLPAAPTLTAVLAHLGRDPGWMSPV